MLFVADIACGEIATQKDHFDGGDLITIVNVRLTPKKARLGNDLAGVPERYSIGDYCERFCQVAQPAETNLIPYLR